MEIKEIPIKNISIKENIRQTSLGKEDLMKSIKDYGLLQAIGVKETAKDEYMLIWGSRRLDACKKLGHKTIPAVIFSRKEDEMTEEEFYIINAIENLHQHPNTLIELGRVVKILRKTMSVSEISARLSIPTSRVNMALIELGGIPNKYQKRIKIITSGNDKQGDIPFTSAIKVSRLRGLKKDQKNQLFEHISKNDADGYEVKALGSLMKLGKSYNQAKQEVNKYFIMNVHGIYVDKDKYNDIVGDKKWIDFVIDCLNEKIPNFAFKSIDKGDYSSSKKKK